MKTRAASIWTAIVLGVLSSPAQTADLTVLCPRAVETAAGELAGDFQKETGTGTQFVFGTAGGLSDRVAAGERADVVIGTTLRLKELEEKGVLVRGSRVELGRVGVGVAIKAGAQKPDISTPEALRKTLLKVTSLGYADPARGGTGGTHFARVVERLGIADALRAKTKLYPQGTQALDAVAKGEIELAVTPTSEIVVRQGLTLAGPLPGDLQNWLSYSAAVLATSTAPDSAKAFIARMTNTEGRKRFIAAGFEPPTTTR